MAMSWLKAINSLTLLLNNQAILFNSLPSLGPDVCLFLAIWIEAHLSQWHNQCKISILSTNCSQVLTKGKIYLVSKECEWVEQVSD